MRRKYKKTLLAFGLFSTINCQHGYYVRGVDPVITEVCPKLGAPNVLESLDTCWTILHHTGDEGWGVKRNTDGNRSSLMRLEALTSAQQADVSRRRSVMEYWLPLFGSCISSHFIWHVLYVLHVHVYVLCVQHNYMYYLHNTYYTHYKYCTMCPCLASLSAAT